jgi:lysosomal alpha-mannosidase
MIVILMYNIIYNLYIYVGREQQIQIMKIPDSVLNIPGRTSTATAELIFVAKHLPPLGFRSYYVSKSEESINALKEVPFDGKPVTIGYNNVRK